MPGAAVGTDVAGALADREVTCVMLLTAPAAHLPLIELAAPARPPAHPMDFPHDAHRRLLDATLSAIAQDRPVPVSGRDALALLELIAAVEASAAGHPVEVGKKKGVA